jgi:hypothetical protein
MNDKPRPARQSHSGASATLICARFAASGRGATGQVRQVAGAARTGEPTMNDPQEKLAEQIRLERELENGIAQAIGDAFATGTAFLAQLPDGGNVLTLHSEREGRTVEVQVIVKVGTPHEVRDDLWDALMDRMDYEVSTTQLANAAMERLGFPTPDGGWPK